MEHVSIKKVNFPVGLNWWWGGEGSRTQGPVENLTQF